MAKKKARGALYIALEFVNMIWYEHEVTRFEQLWLDGVSVRDIGEELGRPEVEVALLVIDRRMNGKIERRPTGVFGKDVLGNENPTPAVKSRRQPRTARNGA